MASHAKIFTTHAFCLKHAWERKRARWGANPESRMRMENLRMRTKKHACVKFPLACVFVPRADEEDLSSNASASTIYPQTKRQKTHANRSVAASTSPPRCGGFKDSTPARPTSSLVRLIALLQSEASPVAPGTPDCVCNQCPYTTGPLMVQRFALTQRLIDIDRKLYGAKSVVHLP